MAHPFGELLTAYRARKHGLTQARLAQAIGYDAAVLARMCNGQRDLTGPSAREKIVSIIAVLQKEGVLHTASEANALLAAANMPPLYDGVSAEASLIRSLPAVNAVEQPPPANASNQPPASVLQHNLPAPITAFIGREQELSEIARRMTTTRLLTLTGAGGSGKTRLALRVASLCVGVDAMPAHSAMHEMRQRIHAVWWIDLVPATDETAPLRVIARALNVAESADVPLIDALVNRLRNDHALLVLDNCEHLLPACATFAMAALQGCPHLIILATSREPLNIMGESVWRVPGLALATRSEAIEQNEHNLPDSAYLFCERAIAVDQDFTLTAGGLATIARICKRLDGMPLAIELAAVQVQSFSLEEIAARLDDQFAFLATDKRMALPRHQTLFTTMAWSDSLLSEDERVFFHRLAVFAGTCSAEAANAIAGAGLPASDSLERLVSKSLVVKEVRDRLTRYRMLEPVRQYALARLAERGEEPAARQRHFLYFVEHAERVDQRMTQMRLPDWIALFGADYDNMNAALDWAGKSIDRAGQMECALRLAVGAANGRHILGDYVDGLAALQLAFGRCDAVRAPATAQLRAVALMKIREYQLDMGDWDGLNALQPACEACLAQCREGHDAIGEARVLDVIGSIAFSHKDVIHAEALAQTSFHLFVDNEVLDGIWHAGMHLAEILAQSNKLEERATILQTCIDQLERLGDFWYVLTVVRTLARVRIEQGNLSGASALLQKNLKLSEALDDHYERLWTFDLLVLADYPIALERAERFLLGHTDVQDHPRMAAALHQLARVLFDGEASGFVRAAHLLDESIEHWRKCGIAWARTDSLAHTLITRGLLARCQGFTEEAVACLEAGLQIAHEFNDRALVAWTQMQFGFATAVRNPVQAQDHIRQSLIAYRDFRYKPAEVLALALLAGVQLQRRTPLAIRLLGACAAHRHELTLISPRDRRDFESILAQAQAHLTDKICAVQWAEGQAMTLDQAIDLALQR